MSLPTRADPPTCCLVSRHHFVVVVCVQAAVDDDWIEDFEIAAGDEDLLDCDDDNDFCQRCEEHKQELVYHMVAVSGIAMFGLLLLQTRLFRVCF